MRLINKARFARFCQGGRRGNFSAKLVSTTPRNERLDPKVPSSFDPSRWNLPLVGRWMPFFLVLSR